jgi:hypothetical protein
MIVCVNSISKKVDNIPIDKWSDIDPEQDPSRLLMSSNDMVADGVSLNFRMYELSIF